MNSVTVFKTVGVCANSKCEKPLFVGNRIWRKGADQYCHSTCLITSFGKVK